MIFYLTANYFDFMMSKYFLFFKNGFLFKWQQSRLFDKVRLIQSGKLGNKDNKNVSQA